MHKLRIVRHENDLGHVWYTIQNQSFFRWRTMVRANGWAGSDREPAKFYSLEDAKKALVDYKQIQEDEKKRNTVRKTIAYVDKC